ncbi:MAG: hypothetical protein AB1649_24880 [Chloroflexota bacterium]
MKNKTVMPDGNELYREVILPNAHVFSITYWGLWIAILLSSQFGGDWDAMLDYFREHTQALSWQRDQAEGIVNHLLLFRQALEHAGLLPDALLTNADPDFLKKQKAKAKRKLLEFGFKEHEKSAWMIETPRRQRKLRALRGHWRKFPVSPLTFASDLAAIFKTGKYYLEEESFKLERKLSGFLDKKVAHLHAPGQLALYRSFLTVVIENMDGVDDSYGVIGDLYESVFETYSRLDRTQINLPTEIYFLDLLELLVWEDYAFTDNSLPGFFSSLSKSEAILAESILRQQWQELGDLGLGYQSQEALTMLGLLYAQQTIFDQFIPIAEEMGTSAWTRITLLSGAAEKHKRYDLALGVYEACLRPGMHEDYLRKEYEKLKERIQNLPKKNKKPHSSRNDR